jgi:GNAT superfamily N-acetyltransferase
MTGGDAGATWRIRPGQDADGPALIELIRACWSQYPGIRMDVDREMPELHALATYYNGALWVAEQDQRLVGMIAARPLDLAVWEICRVYVDPSLHGGGLGHTLLDVAENHAIGRGAARLALWSDTRFDRAHRFYEKRSYVRHGPIRVLHDISGSLEFGYAKPINGLDLLDVAAAASAARRLSEILVACVNEGSALSFMPPLHPDKARVFWQRVSTEVGVGKRILLAGWRGGTLVAAGMLDLATPENQPHRAEVQKIMVDPAFRRTGLARMLLRALECDAAAAGRSLLTLDTRAGDAGEALYRAEGWHETGRIPRHAIDADGRLCDTVFFWKRSASDADEAE